jgi:small GTP-binding protein
MFAAIANDLNSKPTEKLTDDAEVLKSNEEQNLETENKAKQTENKELRLKLLIVGDSGVGKTSLLRMFSDNIYNADYFPTIGIDFMFKRIEIEEVQIKLQIWDSSGHERFRAIISNYYKSSDGIILIYNSNNYHAFENLNKWHEEIKQHAPGTVKLTVVGNQFENENKIVQYDQGKSFADSIGADFIEVDIKKNENVELAFTKLAKSILVQKDPEVAQKTSELDKKTPNPTQARGLGDELINIIILGDPKVGKSTLILKYTDDQFMPNYISTIGVDFRTKTLTDGSQTVKAQIWDLSGQRRFSGITSTYYKGAQGIILMYNSNDLESFNNLDYWVQSIRTNGKSNVPILVVGNQFDPETPQVTYQQALNFSQRISAKFIQIDVKSGFNVEEAFLSIISSIKSNR